uniref:Phosphatidylinositol glycan anchor biosynthesis class G n=1 Tax=Poecilia mexicana TaxID=48701 RepID=A0A3B3YN03_9TELE
MRVRSSVFACFILIFEVLGVALFLRGFFPVPVKSSFSSKSRLSDLPAEPLAGSPPNSTRLPQPLFRRVVLMVVDALREDFVFGPSGGSHMPYTRYLVEKGSSHSFVAKARPPTVTMPRIKVRCYIYPHLKYDCFYLWQRHLQGYIFPQRVSASLEIITFMYLKLRN